MKKNTKLLALVGTAAIAMIGLQQFSSPTSVGAYQRPTPPAPPERPIVELPSEVIEEEDKIVLPNLAPDLTSELIQILDRCGQPPKPLKISAASGDVHFGAVLESELAVIRSFLHTTDPERIIGRFNQAHIVPGAVVDCTPYVRSDLGATVENDLSKLGRNGYKVTLVNSGFKDSGVAANQDGLTWEIAAMNQEQQAMEFQSKISPIISSKANLLNTSVELTRNSARAHTFESALMELGVSLQAKMVESDSTFSLESSHTNDIFVHMITQVYYTLAASPIESERDARAWLADDAPNHNILKQITPQGRGAPAVPALVDSVQYGRAILIAFEVDRSDSGMTSDSDLKYSRPDGSIDLDILTEHLKDVKDGTVKIYTIGGNLGEQGTTEPSIWSLGGDNIDNQVDAIIQEVERLYQAGLNWTPENMGVPIGVTFRTLGSKPVRLKSHAATFSSLVESRRNGAWQFSMDLDVENDMDGGIERGEWVMTLKHNDIGCWTSPERSFKSGNEYRESGTFSSLSPASWGMDLPSIIVFEVDEQDSGSRGGNDFSLATLRATEQRLEKPDDYDAVYRILVDEARNYARLRESVEAVRSSYQPKNSTNSAGRQLFESHYSEMKERLAIVQADQKFVEKNKDAAIDALDKLESDGIHYSGSADENQFDLYLHPDLNAFADVMDIAIEQRIGLIQLAVALQQREL